MDQDREDGEAFPEGEGLPLGEHLVAHVEGVPVDEASVHPGGDGDQGELDVRPAGRGVQAGSECGVVWCGVHYCTNYGKCLICLA